PVETLATGEVSDNGHATALTAGYQREGEAPAEPDRVLRSKKFPILLQIGEMDCGAACLTMIGRYYGREYRMQTLRELSEVSRDGASLAGLAHAAEKLGFRARPVRAEFRHLQRATLPMIVHWGGNHFIVLYQINKRG